MNKGPDGLGLLLLGLVAACLALFILGAAALLIFPVNTYWYSPGAVVYRDQKWLVSDFEGVITEVMAEEGGWIPARAPILTFRNRDLATEAKLASIRLSSSRDLLRKLRELRSMGYLDGRLIAEKEADIKQLETTLLDLRDASFESAFEGKLRYLHPPQRMLGRFVRKGDALGVVSLDTAKTVAITLGTEFADRIAVGAPVRIHYKSVSEYSDRMFETQVVLRHLDVEENRLLLECDPGSFRTALGTLEDLEIGTVVEARILVKRASFLDRLFSRKASGGRESGLAVPAGIPGNPPSADAGGRP